MVGFYYWDVFIQLAFKQKKTKKMGKGECFLKTGEKSEIL